MRGVISVRTRSNGHGLLLHWHVIPHKCNKIPHIEGIEALKTVLRVVRTNTRSEVEVFFKLEICRWKLKLCANIFNIE